MKKIISLTILCIILFSFGLLAYADKIDTEITPLWTNLNSVTSSLSIDSYGIATCDGTMVHNKSGGTCILVMNLQKYSNNAWSTITTWTAEGNLSCYNEEYRAVTRGTYRLVVTGKVYDSYGNFIESGSATSISKTY